LRGRSIAAVLVLVCGVGVGCGGDGAGDYVPLRTLADQRGLRVGTFLFSAAGPDGPKQQAFQAALHELDLYTLPVFFRLVQPARGSFDFTLPDAVADAAPATTMLFVPGFSNDLIPDWLAQGGFSGAELRVILVEYITRVVEHFHTKYPGRVVGFEIVLEPLSWQNGRGFWHKIGLEAGLDQDEYIRLAFRTARAAAPDAKLYIDDFGVEDAGAKADDYYELVSDLLSQGVPLDGVGFEGHFMVETGGSFPQAPSAAALTANLERMAALGLETMITSVDVAIRDDDVNAATLAQQAAAYRHLLHACLAATRCRAFSTWGLGDSDSWIPDYFAGWGSPLLFDASYARKAAYDAVHAELAD
jgi:endo-1,4-beta-xylanase